MNEGTIGPEKLDAFMQGVAAPGVLVSALREARDALAASERRRKELEAQAAVLAEALRGYLLAQSRMRDRWAEGDDAVKTSLWQALHHCEEPARSILANLPQAVQQHLERDWAIVEEMERIADLTPEDLNIYNINQTALNVKAWAIRAIAAYRAAGGEVGE